MKYDKITITIVLLFLLVVLLVGNWKEQNQDCLECEVCPEIQNGTWEITGVVGSHGHEDELHRGNFTAETYVEFTLENENGEKIPIRVSRTYRYSLGTETPMSIVSNPDTSMDIELQ